MAGIGGSQNGAFGAGISHVTAAGRGNDQSLTLGGSLQASSDTLSPHGVLSTAMGAGSEDDTSWERVERGAGGYQPGQFEQLQDQLTSGTDDNAS